MPPSQIQSLLTSYDRTLDHVESAYTYQWAKEAQGWQDLGVYEDIAKDLALPEGYLHLDFGSGLGHLARAIIKRNPNGRVIAFDRNRRILKEAIQLTEIEGISYGVHTNVKLVTEGMENTPRGIAVSSKARIKKQFVPDPQLLRALAKSSKQIIYIADDIRSHKVLDEFLGGQKVNSASFMLGGVGEEEVHESINPFIIDPSNRDQIFRSNREATVDSVIQYASQAVMPQGELILANRLKAEEGYEAEIDELVSLAAEDLLKTSVNLWDINNNGTRIWNEHDLKRITNKLNWPTRESGIASDHEITKYVLLMLKMKLIRNQHLLV